MAALNQADIMREKQRIAELKKKGEWVEEDDKPKKEYDMSYLQQFEDMGLEEEEKKQPEEEEKKQESEVI